MASPDTLEFTEANFDSTALSGSEPVLVDFWAEWCGPCRAIAPMIYELATAYSGKAKVGKVDIDSNQGLAVKYGVQAIPTLMLLKDGEVVQKWVGMVQKPVLEEALASASG